jgi:hypothetical protein
VSKGWYNGWYKARFEKGSHVSSPLVSPEFKSLYVGDTKDDDGTVIDALVQEVDAPATPVTEDISSQTPLETPVKYTRLMSGTLIITSADYLTPTLIVPADAHRKMIWINGFSLAVAPAAKDYVILSDENGKVTPPGTIAMRIRHLQGFSLVEHTGAIWAMPGPITTDNFELTWAAVTS